MTSPILQPSRVDLVPAEAVESIMADTQRELGGLDSERATAEAAADEAERQATSGAGDPAFHAWVAGHADRFVQSLRDEHENEMRSLLETAQRRARACVERAHVDADMLITYASALRGSPAPPAPPLEVRVPEPAPPPPEVQAPEPPAPPVFTQPVAPVPVFTPPDAPEPGHLVWRPDETPTPAPAPVPIVQVPVVPVVVAPVAPASVPDAPVVVDTPVVAEPVAEVAAPPVAMTAPPPPPPDAPSVALPAPVPAAEPQPEAPAENADGRVAKLKAKVGQLPTFAILQVLAVIIVLIIVLIRIG